jgi:adenine-specific DNA-methyltransferase
MLSPSSIPALVSACVALGAAEAFSLTDDELDLIEANGDVRSSPELIEDLRSQINAGSDPLGDAYASIRSPLERRPMGQTYTPEAIVASMTAWAADRPAPGRVVDPGAGSGRYLLAAARAFPEAVLVGLDIDPLATLMLRANLSAAGLSDRAQVILGDYRALELPAVYSPTLFIGNPPYVRHHEISDEWKVWFGRAAADLGIRASKLAGLHIHFFVATARHGRPGDYGAFITSSEWLDVNYGSALRELLLGALGGTEIHVLEPEVAAFPDAQTTAAITCFELGTSAGSLSLRRVSAVDQLGRLGIGRPVSRQRLADSSRWSVLTRTPTEVLEGFIELGELCRVHRGSQRARSLYPRASSSPRSRRRESCSPRESDSSTRAPSSA